jgi:deoxycytidylate deaminase
MKQQLYSSQSSNPDLVIALVSPLGSNTGVVRNSLESSLGKHGYKVRNAKIIDWLNCQIGKTLGDRQRTATWYAKAQKAGNAFCEKHKTEDALARLAIYAVADLRARANRVDKRKRLPNAFILTSLKRPAEVELLRAVYGRSFLLLGVHDTPDAMVEQLAERLAANAHRKRTDADTKDATDLIVTDASEPDDRFGQRVGKTYPLADAFLDASRPESAASEAERLVNLMFRPCFHTPTMDEHAMIHAHAAGLRSIDLARQVGAALVSPHGDVLTTGTNDVPRAGGGIAWEGDQNDARDYKLRRNVSKERRVRTASELVSLLKRAGTIAPDVDVSGAQLEVILKDSQLFALGEFGRTVHAEMDAILSAARAGISVRGGTLYTTTFPCHNCVRHLVGAGMTRVVYMLPFEKSLAFELHEDAIVKKGRDPRPEKVVLERFVGVAPRRYADFFSAEKDERKDENDEPALDKERELKDQFRVDRLQHAALELKVVKGIPQVKAADRRALDLASELHH